MDAFPLSFMPFFRSNILIQAEKITGIIAYFRRADAPPSLLLGFAWWELPTLVAIAQIVRAVLNISKRICAHSFDLPDSSGSRSSDASQVIRPIKVFGPHYRCKLGPPFPSVALEIRQLGKFFDITEAKIGNQVDGGWNPE